MWCMKHATPRRSDRRHSIRILRRVGAAGIAVLALAIATVGTAAEAGEFLLEGGAIASSE
jgi:hypothetical protein